MLKITWTPPLDKFFSKTTDYPIDGEQTLATVLIDLRESTPAFEPFARFGPNDPHPYGLLIWRNRKLLTLKDLVRSGDELEVVVMVAGG